MWATGMMTPDWWKEAAISRTWYRDENAFADHQIQSPFPSMKVNHLRMYYNGAKADFPVTFGKTASETGGTVQFENNGEPFELKLTGPVSLKDLNGADKFIVTKIVYENDTLAFTLTDNGTNEEISVTMVAAPEGFETDKFSSFDNAEKAEAADNNETPSPAKAGPWDCACGTHNTGNFCTACGSPRKNN